MLEFDVAWSHFDVAWGHFDVAWQKLWHKNDVFDEILGCAGHWTLPKKKWAPVAVKIFYKYACTGKTHSQFLLQKTTSTRNGQPLSSSPYVIP